MLWFADSTWSKWKDVWVKVIQFWNVFACLVLYKRLEMIDDSTLILDQLCRDFLETERCQCLPPGQWLFGRGRLHSFCWCGECGPLSLSTQCDSWFLHVSYTALFFSNRFSQLFLFWGTWGPSVPVTEPFVVPVQDDQRIFSLVESRQSRLATFSCVMLIYRSLITFGCVIYVIYL